MVIIFGYVLYYTKLNIFTTLNEMLQVIAGGGKVDPQLISQTSQELDQINLMILGGMVVFSAITGIIAAHITLVPTKDEFAQRKRFITAVAHELRTPLAVLRTGNEVALFDVAKSSPLRDVLESNIEETKHISNILNNLIIFSRAGAEESLTFEATDVSQTLQSALKKLSTYVQKHDAHVTYAEKSLPSIHANGTALEQVFYNLIKNAVIYCRKDSPCEVTIATSVTPSHVVVAITDNGIGMSQKNLKHIFEPFFRVNPDNSQAANGTGLGLSLVFEIMKLHKGIINVESTEDAGTTFALYFPLQSASIVQEPIPHNHNSVSYSFDNR